MPADWVPAPVDFLETLHGAIEEIENRSGATPAESRASIREAITAHYTLPA